MGESGQAGLSFAESAQPPDESPYLAMASLGFIIANATTLALGEARRAAGTGSAVMGAAQFGLAAVISPLVGLGSEDTAVPMAVAMLVSAVVGLGAVLVGTRTVTPAQ